MQAARSLCSLESLVCAATTSDKHLFLEFEKALTHVKRSPPAARAGNLLGLLAKSNMFLQVQRRWRAMESENLMN